MQIVNIVATVKVAPSFNLEKLKDAMKDAVFSTSNNSWLKMRLMPEGYYTAFYKSGKFLVTGIKSPHEVYNFADRVIALLQDAGIAVTQKDIKIHNFVIQDKIDMTTTLEKLMYALDHSKCNYEPEQFPALIYKDWGATFLLFSTGKITVTGIKEEEHIESTIDNFKQLIMSYS